MPLWRVDRQNSCMDARPKVPGSHSVRQPLAPQSNFDDYDKVTDLCDGEPYDMSSPEWDVDF